MKKINRALLTAIIVASSVSLGACTTENPYHGQDQINNATRGAGIGAATGAVVAGIATAGTGAVVGAAVGAGAVGTAVGYKMDQTDTAIREQLRSVGVSVIEVGYSNDLILLMPSDIRFATGSAELTPHFKNVLSAVAEVMKKYNYTVADIPGNADSVGSSKYNMQLSLARAQAVADYLVAQGVAPDHLVPQGYGEMRPVASNATAKGRAMNRHVQIILHAPPIPLRK